MDIKLWIRAYYQDLLERSENKRKKDLLELLADEKKYAPCFEGLDQLTESVFKRIFSKKYLGNTKTFEQEMQSHVISTAKKKWMTRQCFSSCGSKNMHKNCL